MGHARLANAAKALQPLHQGDLDSLCGLYAIINAVQLALHGHRRLTRPELVQLFDAGLDVLRWSRSMQAALVLGMPPTLWRKVGDAVLARATAITGHGLALVAVPVGTDDELFGFLRKLRWNVERQRPVLLCVEGRLNHWTVVRRVSRSRLTLFDSSHHYWLSVRLVTLGGEPRHDRYVIPRHGVLALHWRDPPP